MEAPEGREGVFFHEVDAAVVSVDAILIDKVLPILPLGESYIGPQRQAGSGSVLLEEHPAHYNELSRLKLPTSGFSSQPWWNDKFVRKGEWQRMGIEAQYLVPSLYHSRMSSARTLVVEDGFEETGTLYFPDEDDYEVTNTPEDADFRETVRAVLQEHGRLVLKPVEGNLGVGVMSVAWEAGRVVVGKQTTWKVVDSASRVETLEFDDWCDTHVVHNAELHNGKGILLEPVVLWDNEVKCICIAGGRVIVMGAAGGFYQQGAFGEAAGFGSEEAARPVDPIVVVDGQLPLLLKDLQDEKRDEYFKIGARLAGDASVDCPEAGPRAAGSLQQSPSLMLLQQKEASGRKLWEVIVDFAKKTTATVGITRVDCFVRFARENQIATIYLNEVEHGWTTTGMPCWFGMHMTEFASKAWLLANATAEERAAFVSKHRRSGD